MRAIARSLIHRLLAAALGLVIAFRLGELMRTAWAFTTDDAFITLRYAKHWVNGHGIVWNVGDDPSPEGYSNFLNLVLAAFSMKGTHDPIVFLKAFNAACVFATCGFLYRFARTWVGPVGATIPALLLIEHRGVVWWGVSGLETGSYQLFVVSAVVLTVHAMGHAPIQQQPREAAPPELRGAWLALAGVCCLLAALCRPEGPIVFLVILSAIMWRCCRSFRQHGRASPSFRRELRSSALFIAIFAIPYAVYSTWRVAHFEALLPNTVACKAVVAGASSELVRDYTKQALPLLLLGLLHPVRLLDERHWLLWSLPLAYFILLRNADPVVGDHGRHFMAPHALVTVAAAVGLVNAARFTLDTKDWIVEPAIVLGSIVVLGGVGTMSETELARAASSYAQRMDGRSAVAAELRRSLPPAATYAAGDVGMLGYATPQRIIDVFCLNSREMNATPIDGSTDEFLSWMLAKRPHAIVVHSSRADRLEPRTEYELYPKLLALHDFRESYEEPARGLGAAGYYYWIFRRKPDR